jgi:SAM-dependent methyltransferase
MSPFEHIKEEEVQRLNQLQRQLFDKLYHLFEPPLPEGVPERLERIVASGEIAKGETVLDVGSGTGVMIPVIRQYEPARIHACDLSEAMLTQLSRNYRYAATILGDVRNLRLPESSLDVVFINACYPNIVDKVGAFSNIGRMTKPGGRLVISHPMGKSFIEAIRDHVPFPLDDFPERDQAESMLEPLGFSVERLTDESDLYILVARKAT